MADADGLIAIRCYNAAQRTGQPVTMALVRQVIEELLTHPAECECGKCEAASIARVQEACDIAASWQRAVATVPRRRQRAFPNLL